MTFKHMIYIEQNSKSVSKINEYSMNDPMSNVGSNNLLFIYFLFFLDGMLFI